VSEGTTRGALDAKIASAAARDPSSAAATLREVMRIFADTWTGHARRAAAPGIGAFGGGIPGAD
jgi:hypothetical protein